MPITTTMPERTGRCLRTPRFIAQSSPPAQSAHCRSLRAASPLCPDVVIGTHRGKFVGVLWIQTNYNIQLPVKIGLSHRIGGWGGIRTHEEPRDPCRFSGPVPSTARPPIRSGPRAPTRIGSPGSGAAKADRRVRAMFRSIFGSCQPPSAKRRLACACPEDRRRVTRGQAQAW